VASLRSEWVKGKARAVKANGGKDPWKEYKIKDQKLGPALDAFEAATAKFDAFDKKYDKFSATESQKQQYERLRGAQEMAAKTVSQRYRNYQVDFQTLVKRDQLKKEVLDAVEGGFVPFYRATRNLPNL